MSYPQTIFFFPNGLTAVCDEYGYQMSQYQGLHWETIGALRRAGVAISKLRKEGKPLQFAPSWYADTPTGKAYPWKHTGKRKDREE